ncbi:MAG: large conductance mechanosensitive channel protein MscL [Lachnospiraceae bacterium]|jgi:large conductance mechanosensitive channel|nr:large conductance mechanosensitive channel protein MscL [Lachnospiraceae bacterium]
MKKFFNEFRVFITKGNVVNLAVGVIIGAAFQKVITSLTDNVISPVLGLLAGANFDSLSVTFLGVTLTYGAFLTSLVDFILMAFVIFLIVKFMNYILTIGKKDDEAQPETKECPYCLSQINVKAVKCPNCTSELPTEKPKEKPAKK